MSRPLGHKLRAILFNLVFFGGTGMMAIFGVPFAVTPWRWSMGFGRTWSRWSLAWLRWIIGLGHEVRGWENLPPGPCLIAMKHQSAWDTLIMPVLLGDPAVVIKRELKLVPLYGWYASRAGSIFVDRKGGASALKDMVAQAKAQVARDRKIVIFPQGTRTAPGEHGPAYQPGVAALYQALGLPLVPAAVNSGLYWGRRSFTKRPGRIILEFLPAIPPGQPRRTVMAEMEARIETATTRLVAEGS
ncbi:MAG TPA: lysophospholipid acyltransferase family protein [Stellaceae bacterium]|jgi:1-acyl-sn-glycerol-3-phosphate acyltransferase